ncbi:Slp family lipoprotein [Leptospirillum ferriphilum]|jgi:outer membrane lipoprotein|uniref:Outer membrane lipoprotein n=2 Tax=Leptospirillum TaxID=179 RepID=A0A094X3M5_9BACT|nr:MULTISPECIES: Slp family lipoprotein [Leptospirillum]EAY57262.1 MAG: protein of unknown function [Leptospirillum rubarum]EDZ38740.1 MAG: Protein of unknown function [Leptospirillum sp. Group II '5-way CG']EIJ77351.1 MAG: hypothetical protein C75L2_00720004 [Leptospirillum sp. Group II 'C75']AKS23798.1 hypothetical protein ABH19_08695 [Leptospirillum sp. Group II 'CF-1']KGA93184.1 hypothetical protein LptCag_1879 [Leptospirillum ferriphilum]
MPIHLTGRPFFRFCEKLRVFTMLAVVFSVFSGCALFDSPPFPKQEVRWADRQILFRDIAHHPESLQGQHVILGGKILNITRKGMVSTIIVKEYPLGKELHPDTEKPSMGIFEIVTDEFLPADRYKPGHKMEVIGTVIGPTDLRTAGGRSVRIPVIRGRHLHAQAPAPPPMPMDMMDPGFMDPGFMGPGFMGPGMMMPGFF